MNNGLPLDPTQRWFEHYPVGAVYELGSFSVSEQEIIDFAVQYDPQDMHVDPVVAKDGPFGEVIASGWQTIALTMQLFVKNFLPKNGLPAPGIDELRWLLPVRPGDRLSVRFTVSEARVSRSRSDRGLVQGLVEVSNQRGELAFTMKPTNFVRVRPG
jgi:acyl dehydratase